MKASLSFHSFDLQPSKRQLTTNHDSVCIVEWIERIQLCWSSIMEIHRRNWLSSRWTNFSKEPTNFKIRQEKGWKQGAACTLCWWVASPARCCYKTDDQIDTPGQHITHGRTQKTSTIQTSPIINRPPPATSTSPVIPPKKKSRTQSLPAPTNKKKNHTRYDSFDFSYPIHEKYVLQEVYNIRMMNSDTVIVKAQRLQRPDATINIDLPAFFMYKLNSSDKKWVMVKGPTSKFYVENISEHIEKKLEKGRQQENIISWYNYLEEACADPGGQIRFYRLATKD